MFGLFLDSVLLYRSICLSILLGFLIYIFCCCCWEWVWSYFMFPCYLYLFFYDLLVHSLLYFFCSSYVIFSWFCVLCELQKLAFICHKYFPSLCVVCFWLFVVFLVFSDHHVYFFSFVTSGFYVLPFLLKEYK